MWGATPRCAWSTAAPWHNIVMWGRAGEFAEKYIRKGLRLLIEGKLRTRSWEDHNAIKRYITEIYVDTFELLPK